MSKEEEKNLIRIIESIDKKTEAQHELFTQAIQEINEKLDELKPVAEVYQAFAGFGSIAKGFLTWVIIPLSVIFGLFLTIKNLFK